MAIYLGESGFIELERESLNSTLTSDLNPEDVNEAKRRFSFDFDSNAIITGDRLRISTVDGSSLELVAGHDFPDGAWYVNVDSVGGIRLYDSFAAAIEGDQQSAIALVAPSQAQQIYVDLADSEYRCIGQVQQYEISTSRDTIDITNLGDEFRRQYANGLIQGQGSLSCFWDYRFGRCDDNFSTLNEVPHYLAKLVIRTQLGGSFLGRFFLHRPSGSNDDKDFVWYEARCIVTNCAMSLVPTEPIVTRIDFVTSGEFGLHVGTPPGLPGMPSYLLQESGDWLLQESGSGILLEGQ